MINDGVSAHDFSATAARPKNTAEIVTHEEISAKYCSYGLCYNRKDRVEDRYCRECQKALDELKESNDG